MTHDIHHSRRPPVVAVLGHIDHGKSTLLDFIRKSSVVEKEAGGITQKVSAYEVKRSTPEGERLITLIDTPGHEAFGAARMRGANAADIAVLVVSAEDGVKPQTVEAFQAIQESGIPFIVAINKIDKPSANIEKTKQSLAENEIYLEGYGGNTSFANTSAKTGTGIDELLDLILLTSDIAELRTDFSLPGEGVVLEAHCDQKKGITSTLIIKNGTLRKNTFLSAGNALSPVRAIQNFLGKNVDEAAAGSPAMIAGWSSLPQVGMPFTSHATKREAEEHSAEFQDTNARKKEMTIEPSPEKTIIPIILRADLSGSVDAILHEIQKIPSDRSLFKILSGSAGNIAESDIKTAAALPGTIILGFNTKVDPRALDMALRDNVEIKTFDVIYHLSEWLLQTAKERTPKMLSEEKRGVLKVLKLFSAEKNKQVIGGRVLEGEIWLHDDCKIFRREAFISKGKILELQHHKVKTSKVGAGNECGLLIESKFEVVPGDVLETFTIVEK